MCDISKLIIHYQSIYPFKEFYPRLLNNIAQFPQFHTDKSNFLEGYKIIRPEAGISETIEALSGDVRIDLPVWFGNINAERRYIFIGLEPRDTRNDFNVEKVNNEVYATPFGIEKSYSRYNKLFVPFVSTPNTFHLFMDVVKKYEVLNKQDKSVNDKNARKNFPRLSMASREFIKKELEIIRPTTIFCLGSKTNSFMNKYFANYHIIPITHPAAWGGMKKAEHQLKMNFHVK